MAVWGLTASTSRGLRHDAVNHIMCSGFTTDALSTLTRRIWRHELHPINNAVLAGTALGPDIIVSHEIEGMYVCANLLQNMWHSGKSVRLAIGNHREVLYQLLSRSSTWQRPQPRAGRITATDWPMTLHLAQSTRSRLARPWQSTTTDLAIPLLQIRGIGQTFIMAKFIEIRCRFLDICASSTRVN